MPVIRFSTRADVFDYRQNEVDSDEDALLVEEIDELRALDGLRYDTESLLDYLADGEASDLADAVTGDGYLRFAFSENTGDLRAVTEYITTRKLDEDEVDVLREYTLAQWIDGVGASFYQERIEEGLAPEIAMDDEIIVEQRLDLETDAEAEVEAGYNGFDDDDDDNNALRAPRRNEAGYEDSGLAESADPDVDATQRGIRR